MFINQLLFILSTIRRMHALSKSVAERWVLNDFTTFLMRLADMVGLLVGMSPGPLLMVVESLACSWVKASLFDEWKHTLLWMVSSGMSSKWERNICSWSWRNIPLNYSFKSRMPLDLERRALFLSDTGSSSWFDLKPYHHWYNWYNKPTDKRNRARRGNTTVSEY